MAGDDLYSRYMDEVCGYLGDGNAAPAGFTKEKKYTVLPLAAGEYNLNYLVQAEQQQFVFRVNIASQIDRDDQIVYEYKALQLLASSGVTPRPYWVDDSRRYLDRGVSIMEFLPGRPLDYQRDLGDAAKLFATIHQLPVDAGKHELIVETNPLSLIFDECSGLLEKYFSSPLADFEIADYLREVKDWAAAARLKESYFAEYPCFCIVNTEVNSGNFIVNDAANTIHLIDWEMPRWGDPSSDLCHFCSPMTTLWKTEDRLTDGQYEEFMTAYSSHLHNKHLQDTLVDRLRLKMPFVYLRGISWSAMGWVAYQTDFCGIRNEDTWQKLCSYLDLAFIRSLFDPFLEGSLR